MKWGILGLFFYSGVFACEAIPPRADLKELRFLMATTLDHYRYHLHIEFPDLKKLCWDKGESGTLQASLNPEEPILFRYALLDESQSNVTDTIRGGTIQIVPQDAPGYLALETPRSEGHKSKVWYFFHPAQGSIIGAENLYIPVDSKILQTDAFLRAD